MNEIKDFISSLPLEVSRYLIFDLSKAMKQNKRLDVWDPIPQSSPYLLGKEHKEIFEKARRLIEEKWHTKLEEVDDDLELKIYSEFREAYWEKFKAEEGYDEAETEALLIELRKISPYKPTPPELRAVPVS
jgi:hypothetical protein